MDANPANNGNVMSWSATGAQSFSRSYTYDELNRLKAMASTGTSCTALEWTYDIWANRTNQNIGQGGAACGTHHPTINTKNQIVDTGYVYDAAGNMTQEPGKTYQYDAEGRLKSLNNGCAGSGPCYVYDANGRRVRKIASGVTTEYIYGAGGVVAEKVGTTWTVGYVYLHGQLLAQYKNGTTRFAHKDHLGSTRLLTKPDGSHDPADVYDFLPYGEPVGSQSTTTSHKFTGHERDAESGLDFMQARYYANASGRFLSADPLLKSGRPSEPQSWNRYTYVLNRPLSFIDPNGMWEWSPNLGGKLTDDDLFLLMNEANEKGDIEGANRIDDILRMRTQFRDALEKAKAIASALSSDGPISKMFAAAVASYGEEGKGGPIVGIDVGTSDGAAFTKVEGNQIIVAFKGGSFTSDALFVNVAHEGVHVVQAQGYLESGHSWSLHAVEAQAYLVSAQAAAGAQVALIMDKGKPSEHTLYDPGWGAYYGRDKAIAAIDKHLNNLKIGAGQPKGGKTAFPGGGEWR